MNVDQSNKEATEMQNLLKNYKSCCCISNACVLFLLCPLNSCNYEHSVLQSFMDHRLLNFFFPWKKKGGVESVMFPCLQVGNFLHW